MNVNPSTLEITATILHLLLSTLLLPLSFNKWLCTITRLDQSWKIFSLFRRSGSRFLECGQLSFLVSYAFIDPDGWRTYKMLEDGSYFLNADGAHVVAGGALKYLMSVNFTEPAFVFVIMAIAGSRLSLSWQKK